MAAYQRKIEVRTPGRGLTDLTDRVAEIVRASGISLGSYLLFCRHTSADLLISDPHACRRRTYPEVQAAEPGGQRS